MSRVVGPDTIACLTIYQEARSEPFEDKVMVGEVIRNRTADRYHSDGTLEGTCLARAQFSGWTMYDPNLLISLRVDTESVIWQECVKAWATSNSGTNLANGADSYYNPAGVDKTPPWAQGQRPVAQGLHHRFYRLRK